MKNLYYSSSIMSKILKEAENPPFSIRKRIIPAGTLLNHYDPTEGRIFKVKFMNDFPIITLKEDSHIWMSDTPFELEGMANSLKAAYGRVLIGGLGLGMFPYLIGLKRKVREVDIIEKEQKVIDLVFPQIPSLKLNVVCDDIYHYVSTTQARYDFIYLDIWPDIIGPIQDVDKAVAAAQRCLKPGGEVRVWLQELIDRVKDKLPKISQGPSGPITLEPCLVCGKYPRNDYAGLCMDCADLMGVSELFIPRK